MKKIVLITGSSGLIGSNLVDILLENNYKVIGVSKNYPFRKNASQFKNVNYIPLVGDVCDFDFLYSTFKKHKPQFVIHLAAQAIVSNAINSPIQTFEVNIKGTWNVLEVVKKLPFIKRTIVASSDKAYGHHKKLPYKEKFKLKAKYPYDISKKITENLATSYHETFNLPITITRCGNVFGMYDINNNRIVPQTINAILNKQKIILRSSGTQTRCYVYAKDVAMAYLKILESPIEKINGQVFNIGNEYSISVLEIVKVIGELMNFDTENNIDILNESKFEIQNQKLDCEKIYKILNWKTVYNLKDSLKETIDWYRKLIKSNLNYQCERK